MCSGFHMTQTYELDLTTKLCTKFVTLWIQRDTSQYHKSIQNMIQKFVKHTEFSKKSRKLQYFLWFLAIKLSREKYCSHKYLYNP